MTSPLPLAITGFGLYNVEDFYEELFVPDYSRDASDSESGSCVSHPCRNRRDAIDRLMQFLDADAPDQQQSRSSVPRRAGSSADGPDIDKEVEATSRASSNIGSAAVAAPTVDKKRNVGDTSGLACGGVGVDETPSKRIRPGRDQRRRARGGDASGKYSKNR